MRFITAITLGLLSMSAFAESPLRSDKMKNDICFAVERDIEREDSATRFDHRACKAGEFIIVNSTRDPRTNATTLMQVRYTFTMGQLAVKGHAQMAASQRPDDNGRMVQTWGVRSTRTTLNDSRDIVARIQEELNREDNEIDTGNGGDYGMSKIPGYTVAKAKRDITRGRPNTRGGCQYETEDGIDYVLRDYTFNRGIENSNLPSLLNTAKAQGKIKGAVMRTYSDGESEYCSHYDYIIIFSDDSVLSLSYDGTT